MTKFIEVTVDSEKILINTSIIKEIEVCIGGGTTFYCGYRHITVNESYDEIKKMLI